MDTINSNSFSKNLFWDADIKELDFEVHKAYVVGRVLDYGEWNDWLVIRSYYGMDEIKKIALRIRIMFPKSLSFIATVTDTPENRFRCYEQIKNSKTGHPFIS
jgi:hypothetical protein